MAVGTNKSIGCAEALKGKADAGAALALLQRLGEAVAGIMDRRAWRVGTLKEFQPPNKGLLGMNVNRGQTILVRLRRDGDSFLEWESLLGTMLHELCHNKYGPHSHEFYTLLDELWEEYERGGGPAPGAAAAPAFGGRGARSGGQGRSEGSEKDRREQLRRAAERRLIQSAGPGRTLGGAPACGAPGARPRSARELAAAAAESRRRDGGACIAVADGHSQGDREADDTESEQPGVEPVIQPAVQPAAKPAARAAQPAVQPTAQPSARSSSTSSSSSSAAPAPAPVIGTRPGSVSAPGSPPPRAPKVWKATEPATTPSLSGTLGEGWSCPECTLINAAGASGCAACGLPREFAVVAAAPKRARAVLEEGPIELLSPPRAAGRAVVDLSSSP
jgi:hypothetical protein